MHARKALLGIIVGAASIAMIAAAPAGAKTTTTKLTAKLSGANVVPPGDPDGSGKAKLTLTTKKGKLWARICAHITFQGIEPPLDGLVHGGDLLQLFEFVPAGAISPVDECVKLQRSFVVPLAEHPRRYYVELTNLTFPLGAIRGQLRPR